MGNLSLTEGGGIKSGFYILFFSSLMLLKIKSDKRPTHMSEF